MVILGLGSNVGDRLLHFRKAIIALKKIPDFHIKQISPVYLSDALLPENAPPEWDMPHLNLAIACETSLNPYDLLAKLKNIEWSIGRKPEVRHWGPRILDIDILAFDDLVIESETLTVPHRNLQERPFALWPLADVAPHWVFPFEGDNHGKQAAEMVEKWGSRFSGLAPFRAKQIYQRVDTPALMGIINITPDSFSDDGLFDQTEKAKLHAIHLVNAGAEIIDLGAESTAPHAKKIDAETEWSRLYPVLLAILAAKNDFIIQPKISIDTYHVDVARKAIAMGVNWINDVTGLENPAMRELIATSNMECIMMHHVSIPASSQHILPRHENPVRLVYDWAAKQIETLDKAGISPSRIIFDPGIGFGKTREHSLQLVKEIDQFSSLGTRVLVGHSRKLFLSLFTTYPPKERDPETLATTLYLAKKSVDYLRLHHVEMAARGLRVQMALEANLKTSATV